MNLSENILALLKAGNAGALSQDEAWELTRYIETLSALEDIPAMILAVQTAVGALSAEIEKTGRKAIEAARMQQRDQRRRPA